MGLGDFLLLIDCFGKRITFQVEKYRNFNTVLGSVYSIIFYVASFFFIIFFSFQLFLRKHLTLNRMTYNLDIPPSIDINNNNFPFAIGLESPNHTLIIDESIYTIKVNLVSAVQDSSGNFIFKTSPQSLIPCSQLNKTSTIPRFFQSQDINNFYCLNTDFITLEGTSTNRLWSYLTFEFFLCQSETPKCKSQKEIQEKLSNGYLVMLTTDNSITPKNYKKPIHSYRKKLSTPFELNTQLNFLMFYKMITIRTDKGMIFDFYKTKNTFGFDYSKEKKKSRTSDSFIKIEVGLSQAAEVYERRYEKFQNVMANLGGMVHVMGMIGQVITYFVKNILFKNYLTSYFFRKEIASNNPVSFSTSVSKMPLDTQTQVGSPKRNIKSSLSITKRMGDSFIGEENGNKIKIFSSKINPNDVSIFSKKDAEIVVLNENVKKQVLNKTKLNSFNVFCILFCNRKLSKKIKDVKLLFDKMKYLLEIRCFLKLNEEMMIVKRYLKSEKKKNDLKKSPHLTYKKGLFQYNNGGIGQV